MANRLQKIADNFIIALSSVLYYSMYAILLYLFFVNCSKTQYYVTQIQTSKVYPYTYQRTQIPNNQPLFIEQRRRYTTAQTLRRSN